MFNFIEVLIIFECENEYPAIFENNDLIKEAIESKLKKNLRKRNQRKEPNR